MGKRRVRYNEKARSGGKDVAHQDENSNALIIDPNQKKEKPAVKVEEAPMSSKKKKRLEAYITKKLKKEERVKLFEKLSTTTWSSDLMRSSKTIGQGKDTTKQRLRQAIKEEKAGLPFSNPNSRLYVSAEMNSYDEEEDEEDDDMSDVEKVEKKQEDQAKKQDDKPTVFGGALKRSADGEIAVPIKKKKKKNKTKKFGSVRDLLKKKNEEAEDSFDSSNSEFDSDVEEIKSEGSKSDEHTERSKTSTLLDEQEDLQLAPNLLESHTPKPKVEKTETIQVDDKPKEVVPARPAYYRIVNRNPDIQTARLQLPVCSEEQVIMEAISDNSVIVICGETGSGKTTQLPQFLYEAGYGSPDSEHPGIIGVTQPRRVAAVSMAKRVAQELNLSDQEVSHQIRYDATVSAKTAIKFMTDGVLLRELAQDFLLTKYSAIIIDEAHERSLNTDILIGVVSRVLKLREDMSKEKDSKVKPLKVIVMSATLRVSDFTENQTLFSIPPPVVNVNARQYPVQMHFNKKTPLDYVSEAYKKVSRIHKRLPPGGILIFMTGQNEISILCKKLRKKFPMPAGNSQVNLLEDEIKNEEHKRDQDFEAEEIDVNDIDDNAGDIDTDLESDGDESEAGFSDEEEAEETAPLHILPLYSLLSTQQQLRVFEPPPPGSRLCVIATNVAETSLTIPGVKYVIDCGKVKERQFDIETGVQSFDISWTSKASADQRAGRAGRTGPGHCYRLYSSAVFNDQFKQFTLPEINRMPIEGVVLQMKSMNLDNVMKFPFPTPPDRTSLQKAEKLLTQLGALEKDSGRITDLGKMMSVFPVHPRFAKMLIVGQQHGCLPYIISVVSALSVGDPFVKDFHLDNAEDLEEDSDEEGKNELRNITSEEIAEKTRRKMARKRFHEAHMKHAGLDPSSDLLKCLNVVGAYDFAGATEKFCDSNYVRVKAMQEIRKLRAQLTHLVQINCPGIDVVMDPRMKPPTPDQLRVIRQVILAGFIDQVAIRKDLVTNEKSGFSSTRGVPYVTMWSEEDVFIHPSSVLYHSKPPDMIVYQELQRTSKIWLKGITVIRPKWLTSIGKNLCSFSKPLDTHGAGKKVISTLKDTQECFVIPSFGPKYWKLPPQKAQQKRVGARWVFEKIL
ncbi:putative ATP-dependent RNA helicase DHR1 [Basidiobolus ranarum]|uniref:RNA helicase n=1 Tax=Basidiobolus ranarum TaxID=34480 RepID=A0ABR2WLF0_9FUNG